MDANFNIYSAPEALIPEADKARLDGYLKGREEAALLDEGKTMMEATYEVKLVEMESLRDRVERVVDEPQS